MGNGSNAISMPLTVGLFNEVLSLIVISSCTEKPTWFACIAISSDISIVTCITFERIDWAAYMSWFYFFLREKRSQWIQLTKRYSHWLYLFVYLLLWPSSRLAVWIYSVSKKTVGTNMARTVARRPRKLVSINLSLIANFLKIIWLLLF